MSCLVRLSTKNLKVMRCTINSKSSIRIKNNVRGGSLVTSISQLLIGEMQIMSTKNNLLQYDDDKVVMSSLSSFLS